MAQLPQLRHVSQHQDVGVDLDRPLEARGDEVVDEDLGDGPLGLPREAHALDVFCSRVRVHQDRHVPTVRKTMRENSDLVSVG